MYRQPKAVAIQYSNPVQAAWCSFKNAGSLLVDFMYGTPERVRLTYTFAFALAILGGALMNDTGASISVCGAN